MNHYKIYIYDEMLQQQYPITTYQSNINALCNWLNSYIERFNIYVTTGYLLDKYGGYLDEVEFLPQEIVFQKFITSFEERLVAYNNYVEGGVS